MNENFFIGCAADGCRARLPRATVAAAATAQPSSAKSFAVPLLRGEWWAYIKIPGGGVSSVYCPIHHDLARGGAPGSHRHAA